MYIVAAISYSRNVQTSARGPDVAHGKPQCSSHPALKLSALYPFLAMPPHQVTLFQYFSIEFLNSKNTLFFYESGLDPHLILASEKFPKAVTCTETWQGLHDF